MVLDNMKRISKESTLLKKAIIPVAGLGTRLLPISKSIPKELVPVVDRPLIQHIVEEVLSSGITEIILVTRSGKSAIENHFNRLDEVESLLKEKGKNELLERLNSSIYDELNIVSIRQDRALGLGHAIYCAQHLISPDENFAVILPDVLIKNRTECQSISTDLAKMVEASNVTQSAQIMVHEVAPTEVEQYGIVDCKGVALSPGESTPIYNLVEKPTQDKAPSCLSVVGRYILPGRIMATLGKTTAGVGGEIQLTDAISSLIASGYPVDAYSMTSRVFDCGNIKGWANANYILAKEAGLID
jgi:UTP--glucose-1-phosphate uridylyltransferase